MRLGPGFRDRMLDQRRDGDLHIGVERERAHIGMQLLEAVGFPDAEIGDLPDDRRSLFAFISSMTRSFSRRRRSSLSFCGISAGALTSIFTMNSIWVPFV
jgi:hypothetical protein